MWFQLPSNKSESWQELLQQHLPQHGSQSVLQVCQKQNMNFANHLAGQVNPTLITSFHEVLISAFSTSMGQIFLLHPPPTALPLSLPVLCFSLAGREKIQTSTSIQRSGILHKLPYSAGLLSQYVQLKLTAGRCLTGGQNSIQNHQTYPLLRKHVSDYPGGEYP